MAWGPQEVGLADEEVAAVAVASVEVVEVIAVILATLVFVAAAGTVVAVAVAAMGREGVARSRCSPSQSCKMNIQMPPHRRHKHCRA